MNVLKFMNHKDYKLLTCFNWLLSLFKCYITWNSNWINPETLKSKNTVCLGALNLANSDALKKTYIETVSGQLNLIDLFIYLFIYLF